MFPLHCTDICFNGMAIFHVKGKAKLIIPSDEFGISHVTKKCLCAMFDFHLGIIHVSKDDAYDANNNVIKFIYQVSVISDTGLKWRVNFRRFRIVAKNLPIRSQNFVLTDKTIASIVNVVMYNVEIE
jgi:hypothetical protein